MPGSAPVLDHRGNRYAVVCAALRALGTCDLAQRECWSGDQHSIEHRLFINSSRADGNCFAHAVRGHWGVETRPVLRLDVVFSDAVSRIRNGHAPAIMTGNRHLSMNLFELGPSNRLLSQTRRGAVENDGI